MFDHWNLFFLLTNYIKSSHHKIILWKLLYVSHDTRRLPSVEESQDKYLMMIWCSKRTDGSGDKKEKGSSLLNHFISFNSSFSFSPLSMFCFWCFPSLLPSYLLIPFIIPLFYLYSNSFFSSFLVPVLFFLSYKPFFSFLSFLHLLLLLLFIRWFVRRFSGHGFLLLCWGPKQGSPFRSAFFPCALSLKLFLTMTKMMLNEWMWSWGWHLGGAAASSAGVLRNRQRWGGQRRWRPTRRKTWKQQRHLPASPQHPDSPSARERGVSGWRWRMGWERSCPQRTELLMKK